MQGPSITPADRQRRLDAILERHGKARTELVQILREHRSPRAGSAPRRSPRSPRAEAAARARRGGGRLLRLPAPGPRRPLPAALFRQHHRPHGRLRAAAGADVRTAVGRARQDFRDGLVSVDTTSCTACATRDRRCSPTAGPLPPDGTARRAGRRPGARRQAAGAVAARTVRRRGQRPPPGRPARRGPGAGRAGPRRAGARSGSLRESASNERSWREAIEIAPQGPRAVLEEIKLSNLRGRGGAGFTTGLKWEACAAAQAVPRYVVCNADEASPARSRTACCSTRTQNSSSTA